MKLSNLLESDPYNKFFRIEKPITVWELVGYTPSNHYYGASRLHEPKYRELELQPDDEIHWLVGGLFGIEIYDEEASATAIVPHEIAMTKPEPFSPFEKRYGGGPTARETEIKRLIADKTLQVIPREKAARVKQYRE